MDLSLRCHHWSVLQVVAIVVVYRGKVLSERVQGCVGSQLSLRCPEMKVIKVTAVVLGDTHCRGASCCIVDSDCTYNANANHRAYVHRTCDNKQSCTVGVLQEKIPCGYWGVWYNNDFERITYVCEDDPQRWTTATLSRPYSTVGIMHTEESKLTPEKEPETDSITISTAFQTNEGFYQTMSTDFETKEGSYHTINGPEANVAHEDSPYNSWALPVIMTIVCLLILILIVVAVVIMRRKRLPKYRSTFEMTYNESRGRDEAIHANDSQTINQNHDDRSPTYSNHKIKEAKHQGASTETCELPKSDVNNIANDAGSRRTEDRNNCCDVDSREPAYDVPRPMSHVYSLTREVVDPECAGSTEGASHDYVNVCCALEAKEPDKVASGSAQNAYEEIGKWRQNEHQDAKAEKTTLPTKMENTIAPAHATASGACNKVDKLLKNTAGLDSDKKGDSKGKVSSRIGFPNPIYEKMSSPERIYANAPALSPSSSLVSGTLATGGSETENPYCDMQSPRVRFKDDGSQTVVENDLFSH